MTETLRKFKKGKQKVRGRQLSRAASRSRSRTKSKTINDKKIAQGGEIIEHNVLNRNSKKGMMMNQVAAFNNYQLDYANSYTVSLRQQQPCFSNTASNGGAALTVNNSVFCGFSLNDGYDYLNYIFSLVSQNNASKIFQRSSMLNILMSNSANISCYVDFYLCKCRRDVPLYSTDQGFWNQYNRSWTDQNAATTAGQTLGFTPFQNRKWCEYFKIKRVSRSVIPPGGFIRYILRDKTVYKIESEEFSYVATQGSNSLTQNTLGLKGKTWVVIPVVSGIPINDSSNTTTQVAIGNVKVDVVSYKMYDAGFVSDSTYTSNIYTTNQPLLTNHAQLTLEETGATAVQLALS